MSEVFTSTHKFNIMMSYSHQDSELMARIRDLLASNGFDVWVDTKLRGGSNFFKNIGSAIIGCDIFLFILSEHSVSSKFCQDEVSLARISNKKILPVTYCSHGDVSKIMDGGLRLILSCVQWICLDPTLDDPTNDKTLIGFLNDTLKLELTDDSRLENYEILFSEEESANPKDREKQKTLRRSQSMHMQGFWGRHFGNEREVELTDILKYLKQDYAFDYSSLQFQDTWAIKALTLWCFDLERNAKTLPRAEYDKFLFPEGRLKGQIEGPDKFWVRCKDGFSVRLSMQEVFNTHSSVRYDSIKNLSKIKNKRVLVALSKLLKDSDPNIRAIACISLSHTGTTSTVIIERTTVLLGDSDRLVRESACLALGKYKAAETVPNLLSVWRNDVISDVRAAALNALEAIGTPDAFEEIKVVKTLQDEFKKLSAERD